MKRKIPETDPQLAQDKTALSNKPVKQPDYFLKDTYGTKSSPFPSSKVVLSDNKSDHITSDQKTEVIVGSVGGTVALFGAVSGCALFKNCCGKTSLDDLDEVPRKPDKRATRKLNSGYTQKDRQGLQGEGAFASRVQQGQVVGSSSHHSHQNRSQALAADISSQATASASTRLLVSAAANTVVKTQEQENEINKQRYANLYNVMNVLGYWYHGATRVTIKSSIVKRRYWYKNGLYVGHIDVTFKDLYQKKPEICFARKSVAQPIVYHFFIEDVCYTLEIGQTEHASVVHHAKEEMDVPYVLISSKCFSERDSILEQEAREWVLDDIPEKFHIDPNNPDKVMTLKKSQRRRVKAVTHQYS